MNKNMMNKSMAFKKSQAGFTLVEIAIVLVIIGLLLGGVLKGTELIENAKVKRAINEINGVTSAFYAYQDRYQRLPGDDGAVAGGLAILQARGGAWTNITVAGNIDGILTSSLAQTFAPTAESLGFWQHLKAAGFLNGSPADTGVGALPRNAFGGLIGMTTIAVGPVATPISGRIICSSQVPGKSAAAMDTAIDDGNGATGKMRGGVAGLAGVNTAPSTAAGPNPYVETSYYTICVQI
jgi:prepilin-type N-terminal cleavage/methylation domain-containing protein